MGRKLVVTDGAERDWRKIRQYTMERWGKTLWAVYGRAIEDRMEIVMQKPDRGKKHDDLPPDVLLTRAGHHFLVYRFDDKAVFILRILHECMDFGRHVR